jgi:hypothetical protein
MKCPAAIGAGRITPCAPIFTVAAGILPEVFGMA